MGKIMIIGCGGVGSVAVQKCCQNSDAFSEVVIASRTVSKCDALKAKLEGKTKTKIKTAQVDADDTASPDRADPPGEAGCGAEPCAAVSGSPHHGVLSGSRRALY